MTGRLGPPDHPQLTASQGRQLCLTEFPTGVLWKGPYWEEVSGRTVGEEPGQLLPGLYEYRRTGDDRVEHNACSLVLNVGEDNRSTIAMTYGEPFTFQFFKYHNHVYLPASHICDGALYRVGD